MAAIEYYSTTLFNEDAFEQGIIEHLVAQHGYEHLYGPDVPRSTDTFDDAFLPDVIEQALMAINPGVNRKAIDAAIVCLKEIEGNSLIRE